LKKIKVTRKDKKLPWYERPVILFTAIGVVLAGLGLLMAYLNGVASKKSLAADTVSAADTVQVPMAAPHVLEPGAAVPAIGTGELLPPLRTTTHADAGQARVAYRTARGIERAGEGPATYGFIDVKLIAGLGEAASPESWDRLPVSTEQRTWCDFEVARAAQGEAYLHAFVALDVAEALGALAPQLALAPSDPAAPPPAWQIWKKRPARAGVALWQGARIDLYPDLNPGAECLVALPVARLIPRGSRSARTGLATPVEILEVELR
jgi:hypothetical protein